MGKIKDIISELNLTEEQLKDESVKRFVFEVAARKNSGQFIQYWNGNGFIEVNKNDGTSIRTILNDKPYYPIFPENIDMNISNKCINGCAFCYQGCTSDGKQADINKFINDQNSFLYTLKPGTELAINGNEPLHEDLELLLQFCKDRNVLANLTVQENTLLMHKSQLENWLDNGLIHGIGISPSIYSQELIDFCATHPTAVIHTIVGITSDANYKFLMDKGLKILILGYKDFGRGVNFKEDFTNELTIKLKIDWMRKYISTFAEHFKVVSFDNLALEQLKVKEWLPEDQWAKFYRGDDGNHTMYIDLVNETFAKNSIQPKCKHKPVLSDVKDMLKEIRVAKKNEV